ncbi:MAG: LysR family transcriptional regulator [Pseudomonadota bacterium]
MENWNEIRTAACVARAGTVSAAAQQLKIHRATVNRHIELLEAELGAKLFLRSPRGYTPTDLGEILLRIAESTDHQFAELHRRAKTRSGALVGVLTIAALEVLVPEILPAMRRYCERNPEVHVRLITGPTLARLEYGEADIAFRAGKMPSDPDYVVMPFSRVSIGLFASSDYVQRRGIPKTQEEFIHHDFISPTEERDRRSPFMAWLHKRVPTRCFRYECNEWPEIKRATEAGLAIGFIPHRLIEGRTDLVEITSPRKRWAVETWRVTHADLHRSPKVKGFLSALNEAN